MPSIGHGIYLTNQSHLIPSRNQDVPFLAQVIHALLLNFLFFHSIHLVTFQMITFMHQILSLLLTKSFHSWLILMMVDLVSIQVIYVQVIDLGVKFISKYLSDFLKIHCFLNLKLFFTFYHVLCLCILQDQDYNDQFFILYFQKLILAL